MSVKVLLQYSRHCLKQTLGDPLCVMLKNRLKKVKASWVAEERTRHDPNLVHMQ